MSTDHPVHPATVHFPLTFLTTSYGLDALHYARPYLPAAIVSNLPTSIELSRISYWALGLGVLTALPAISSGVTQALAMVKTQGLFDSEGKLKAKSKVLIAHAVANDVVIALSAYSWWCRRSAGALEYLKDGRNPLAYEPADWMVGASVVLGVVLIFAANLGGTLVYDYGMGLAMGKKSKKTQ